MNFLPLRNKQKEIVDWTQVSFEDYPRLSKMKWHKVDGYTQGNANGRKWLLHRYILSEILKQDINGFHIDHIDRNKLNNTRENLRIATPSQNLSNGISRGGVSKYRGVSFHAKKWRAIVQGKYLGYFKTEEEAGRARDAYCKKSENAEFFRLNFPNE